MDIVKFNIDELPPPPLSWIMDDTSYNGIIFGGLLPLEIEYKIYWFNNQVPPIDLKHIAMNVKLSLFEECINNEVFLSQVKLFKLNKEWNNLSNIGHIQTFYDVRNGLQHDDQQKEIYNQVLEIKNERETQQQIVEDNIEKIENTPQGYKIGALSYISKYNNKMEHNRNKIVKLHITNNTYKLQSQHIYEEKSCNYNIFNMFKEEKKLDYILHIRGKLNQNKYDVGKRYYKKNLEDYKKMYFKRNCWDGERPPREKKYLKRLFELLELRDLYKPNKSNDFNIDNLYNEFYPNMKRNSEIRFHLYTGLH
tara:strand:+ start:129 stop:1052 length:924 start_codon:yes stop_codon:yes gene_type:complete